MLLFECLMSLVAKSYSSFKWTNWCTHLTTSMFLERSMPGKSHQSSQCEQLNGFFPVWTLMWVSKLIFSAKDCIQKVSFQCGLSCVSVNYYFVQNILYKLSSWKIPILVLMQSLFWEFKPDWDSLASFHSALSSVSDSEEPPLLSPVSGCKRRSGSELLAGSDPPQASPSDSVSMCSVCLWWRCEDSLRHLHTLQRQAWMWNWWYQPPQPWLLQATSSFLMDGGSLSPSLPN